MAFAQANLFKPSTHHIQDTTTRVSPANLIGTCWVDNPNFPKGQMSNAQKMGIRYENRIGKKLTTLAQSLGWQLIDHRWISYQGSIAQPDFVLIAPSGAGILFEAKYTHTDTSVQRALYANLLKELGIYPLTSCTICHNLTNQTPQELIITNPLDIAQDSIWQLRI